jgi:hypothetical protein
MHEKSWGARFVIKNGFDSITIIKEIPTEKEAKAEELSHVKYLASYGLKVAGAGYSSSNGYTGRG